MKLFKRILLAALVTVAPSLVKAANPVRYVQISTNPVTQQTGAFNVATGSMTQTSFSTATVNGNTVQATVGTRTYTIPDATANANFLMSQGTAQVDQSTTTHSGGHTFSGTATFTTTAGTVTDNSTTTHTGAHTFSGGVTLGTVGGTITDNSTTTHTGGQTFSGQLSFSAWSYRRPTLQFNSTSRVDIETNTATANTSSILFPDGNLFSVTENLGTTQKYRSFKSGQNAVFTSGTPQGGLRTTLTAAANTWYALYAVKCQMTNETTNYVIVGDTFTPTQANVATLNTNFGSNSWVYLGMIRYGDNSGATTSILAFQQSGNFTGFTNTTANAGVRPGNGPILIAETSVSASTYTYAAGTTNLLIPSNITQGVVQCEANPASSAAIKCTDSSAVYTFSEVTSAAIVAQRIVAPVTNGFRVTTGVAGSNTAIFLNGFWDTALGVGPNPQF